LAALEGTNSRRGPDIRIEPALIESFGRRMPENLTTGSTSFRKAYLRSLIDIVEVDDAQIRIKGSKDVLERAVLAGRSGAEQRSQMSTKWRARHDSNV
jgi:site-specific DNA recombinase